METQTDTNSGTTAADEARRQGHEPNALNMTFLWSVVIGLGVLVLIAMLLMGILFDYFAGQGRRPEELPASLYQSRPLPVEPSLDPNQKQHLAEIRADEAERLSTYDWVDKDRGIARIPIERAMEILVERGLPEPKETPASTEKANGDQVPNAEKESK